MNLSREFLMEVSENALDHLGAYNAIQVLLKGRALNDDEAKAMLRACRDLCGKSELIELQDWLKNEHDMIILLDEF